MTVSTGPTALYRIFGVADLLLYIGISDDFGRRWKEHARLQVWWPERRWMTVDWYDTRADAEAAEETAVKAEGPVHNKVYAVPQAIQRAAARPSSVRARIPQPQGPRQRVDLAELGPFPIPLDELLALPVTVDVPAAAIALGIPADHAYVLIGRNQFPVRVLRYGRLETYRVSRANILRHLGLDPLMVVEDPAQMPAA